MLGLSYRHWFVIALLVLLNVVIVGCVLLVMFDKMRPLG